MWQNNTGLDINKSPHNRAFSFPPQGRLSVVEEITPQCGLLRLYVQNPNLCMAFTLLGYPFNCP